MNDLYPVSVAEVVAWAARVDASLEEARKRYVQYVLLELIGQSKWMSQHLALKGGNALRFCYGNRRSTVDLDFTAEAGFPDDEKVIRDRMNAVLNNSAMQWSVALQAQAIHRKPSTKGTHPTYEVAIGYAFEQDRLFQTMRNRPYPDTKLNSTVPIEISINDVVCDAQPTRIIGSQTLVRCCVLEDIVAEKLRALLQQKKRYGGALNRRQDLHDLARIIRSRTDQIDREKVRNYLIKKSKPRDIEPRRSSFDEAVLRNASVDWDSLFDQFNPQYISVEEAWGTLSAFLDSLSLPE